MAHSFGDVVPFPFTDQSGAKKRPAVIVSSSGYHASRSDLLIMAITSQVRQPLGFEEAIIKNWQAAGLIKPSVLKPVLTTIEQGLVLQNMGALSANDLRTLRETIGQVIGQTDAQSVDATALLLAANRRSGWGKFILQPANYYRLASADF